MTRDAVKESINARLRRIATDKNVAFDRLFINFLIERAAARLMRDVRLYDHLVFKGGYVALRIYQSPRHTVDLDAVIHGLSKEVAVDAAKKTMFEDLGDGVWFQFEKTVDLTTQQEYGGVRLVYRGGVGTPLADVRRAPIVNIDFGIGDPVTPEPRSLATPTHLAGEPLSWRVYPVETIVAEKLHALYTHASLNSRSKDVFDLSFLLPKVVPIDLDAALTATFQFRGAKRPPALSAALRTNDVTTLKRGWKSAVKDIADAPSFDDAFARVLELLVTYGV